MNVLLLHYAGAGTNSLHHLVPLARLLVGDGHGVVLGLSTAPESRLEDTGAGTATHAELLARDPVFPNGGGLDLVHAWTPRETVRHVLESILDRRPGLPLVLHHEDHEAALSALFLGQPPGDDPRAPASVEDRSLPPSLSHPQWHRVVHAAADAHTLVTPRQAERLPDRAPARLWPPVVDVDLFTPASPAVRAATRARFGLDHEESLVVHPGSVTFANRADLFDLHHAVRALRAQGRRVRLVRTGYGDPLFDEALGFAAAEVAVDLGRVPRADVAALVAAADVLVQPGRPGPFNDFRLPSKLPEFLASGRPVVCPRTNLGLELVDGVQALTLASGDRDELTAAIASVLDHPERGARLGEEARRFALKRFSPAACREATLATYAAAREAAGRRPAGGLIERALHRLHQGEGSGPLGLAPALATLTARLAQEAAHGARRLAALGAECGRLAARVQGLESEHRLLLAAQRASAQAGAAGREPPVILHHLDEPAPDQPPLEPGAVRIRGWSVAADGQSIDAVRVVGPSGSREAERILRPDVGAHLPHLPLAGSSGWQTTYPSVPGRHELRVEAQVNGAWHAFGAVVLEVAASAAEAVAGRYQRWWESRAGSRSAEVEALRHLRSQLPAVPRVWLRLQLDPPARLDPAAEASLAAQLEPPARLETSRDAPWPPEAARPFDLVGELAPDVRLEPDALLRAVVAAAQDREAEVFYGDEDRTDPATGARHSPWFKPAWNPALLEAQPYFGALVLWRASRWPAVEPGLTGGGPGRAWERMLRGTSGLGPAAVVALRAPLASRPHELGAPPYLPEADPEVARRMAIPAAEVTPAPGGLGVHLRHPRPVDAPLVSLVVPTRDHPELLGPFLRSLAAGTAGPRWELVLVDHATTDPDALSLLAEAESRGATVLRCGGPFNFSALINNGARAARGGLLGLLNNDLLFPDPSWLDRLVAEVLRPGVGIVSPRLVYPDGRLQHLGAVLGLHGGGDHAFDGWPPDRLDPWGRPHLRQDVSAVAAACLLVSAADFAAVGGFDEEHFPVSFNDLDFCRRVAALGRRLVLVAETNVIHRLSASRGSDDTPAKAALAQAETAHFRARWASIVDRDPHYHPALTLTGRSHDPALPPRT